MSMTQQEMSDLFDLKLKPIETRLGAIESEVKIIKEDVRKILRFVPIGNEDLTEKLHKPKLKKA